MLLEPLDKFREICESFPAVAVHRGRMTEADTRANLLDRIIHETLGWPRKLDVVSREPFANPGFIDYRFSHGRPVVLMEAKAAGETFVFPYRKIRRRTVKIESTLLTDPTLAEAIVQVQKYCSDTGCRFAVATNGYSYVIFRAILEGTPWKSGNAIVFYDPKDITINFTEFWNLLSYEAVMDGKLDAAFRTTSYLSRGYYRPLDDRVDSDATYGRNPLNVYLRPYVERFFGDIALQDTTEILTKCYVYSKPIQIIDQDLRITIEDQIPSFAKTAKPTQHSAKDPGGNVGRAISGAAIDRPPHGSVVLVMGGIGSGKSTFCRRFFRLVAPGLVTTQGHAALLYLNFLGAPDEPTQLEEFLWESVANELKLAEPSLATRPRLEQIFQSEIDITNEIYGATDPATPGRISDLLIKLFHDPKKFGDAALKYCVSNLRMPIIVFDNVDQLTMTAQIQLFTSAQRFANMFGCVSLLVLREESYSAALLKRHLTATTIRPYHLSSPSF